MSPIKGFWGGGTALASDDQLFLAFFSFPALYSLT